jgi:ornithine carbamoyltransferase
VRHLLSLAEVGPDNLAGLVRDSLEIAAGREGGAKPLSGKIVGIYFRGTSTRTRTAFTAGALRLGAGVVAYGPRDLQIETGETVRDTGRVLSGFLDALVVRTNGGADEMQELAAQGRMAVVNAMSEDEHPTQAIADLVTISEALGHLRGVHVLYVGEGNNSAAALALAVAMTPEMRLTLITPEGYGLPRVALAKADEFARMTGAVVEHHHDIGRPPAEVDAVYTTRWQTMGVPKADPDWKEKFRPFSVTEALMGRVSKPSGTIFLHDLPAVRGDDVVDEVLDGPQSRAFRQAEHKMTSAMAVLKWCLADGAARGSED